MCDFMKEQLFDQIDIPVTNYHLPDGTLPIEKIPEFCKDYEDKIEKLGGLGFSFIRHWAKWPHWIQ
jgi:glucosamine-6-phosphate deaminase